MKRVHWVGFGGFELRFHGPRQVMLAFEEASSGQRCKPIQKPSKKRGNRRLAIIESLHTCLKQWPGAVFDLFVPFWTFFGLVWP